MTSLFSLTACAKNFPQERYEIPGGNNSILIAGISSDFRDTIKDRLIDRYKSSGSIDVVGLNQLSSINCSDYNAIILMDQCKAWTLYNLALKSFLKKSTQCNNVVVFITAGDPEWKYEYNGLDAITSASTISNEDRVVNEISLKIDRVLAAPN